MFDGNWDGYGIEDQRNPFSITTSHHLFDGLWSQGLYREGNIRYANGDFYSGSFHTDPNFEGQKQGYGSIIYATKKLVPESYQGGFKND